MKGTNERVLITGGFGFIGYHLTKALLARGYEVVVFGHRNQRTGRFFDELCKKYKDDIELIEGEMLDDELHKISHTHDDITGVFHLAAVKMTTTTSDNDADLLGWNYGMDGEVIDFCESLHRHNKATARERRIKMLYMSTGEVYGATFLTGKKIEEDTMCTIAPKNRKYLYAVSKIMGEMSLNHTPYDFDFNIVRLQNPYGPLMDDRMLIPKMIREAINAKNTGSGSVMVATRDSRPYVYIDDVVKGLIAVYEKGQSKETYNVAGEDINVGNLARLISNRYADGNMMVNGLNAIGSGEHRSVSCKKIELLWSPDTSIEDGLDKMHEHYLKHDAVDRAMKQIGL